MRIAFDTTPLSRAYPPGVVRACKGLVHALRELPDVELIELAPRPGEKERSWRHLHLPAQIAKAQVIGLHSPISAFPARGPGRRVCTVHELPWCNGVHENAGTGHRFWARFAVGCADAVITPTEFVRKQLIADCGGGLHIYTCPWGTEKQSESERQVEPQSLSRFGLSQPRFLLASGANRTKKNLNGVLRALAALPIQTGAPPLQLVVTGHPTPVLEDSLRLAQELGIESRVHAVGFVSDEDLQTLNRAALFAVLMSPSEGFGFPVLEAMSHGRPVMVTEGSAQAEVAGPLGILARPECIESMVAGMQTALQFDVTLAAELRSRATSFVWQRCAEQVRDIWAAWS